MSHEPINAEPGTLEEQLSAYLDGELDDASVQEIERLLAADPRVRETLQRMERTWDVLDKLEEAEVDEQFTRTTLEMVAVAAEEAIQRQEEEIPRRKRRQRIVAGASLTAAAAAGFLAVAMLWPNPNEDLIRHLPVLQDLDQYRQVQDIEFLRGLHEAGLFVGEEGEEP